MTKDTYYFRQLKAIFYFGYHWLGDYRWIVRSFVWSLLSAIWYKVAKSTDSLHEIGKRMIIWSQNIRNRLIASAHWMHLGASSRDVKDDSWMSSDLITFIPSHHHTHTHLILIVIVIRWLKSHVLTSRIRDSFSCEAQQY